MEDNKVSKIFNDPVHGHIEMPPLLVKIIDTPEFQRLRNIKQFAGGYYVFPGASHNRFEHSIGVAHLAGKLVESLSAQRDLGITDKDKLCVQIAGLCHDLGHGPFSHAFDEVMKELKKKRPEEGEQKEWTHEEASIQMFEHLIKVNGIESIMKDKYNFNNEDFLFIMELIYGPNPPSKRNCCSTSSDQWPYKGRTKEKSFLYQIVANHDTGIDVDKMDYFSRDCLHLGMKCNFSHERFMMFARVCTDAKGEKQICMRDKEAMNMYELFHIRYLIRQNACFHRVTMAVELMLVDALVAADNNLKVGEKNLTILEAVKDPETYTDLTDNILPQILQSSNQALNPAKEIIKRILKRDLYTFIGGKIFDPDVLNRGYSDEEWKEKKQNQLEAWLKKVREMSGVQELKLSTEDFKIKDVKLNYGMKEKNPVDSLLFYRKDNPDCAIQLLKDEVSHLLPAKFSETKIMLFYKGHDKDVVKHTKKYVEQLWSGLDPVCAEVNKSRIYVDLTDLAKNILCLPNQTLAHEISERISKQGIIFIDKKTFRKKELEHLNRDEDWKVKLEAWLENVKERTADDFKVVVYTLPYPSDSAEVLLFYQDKSKQFPEKFWNKLVADPPATVIYMRPTDEDLQILHSSNQELSTTIIEKVSKQGLYMFIDEKTLSCEELEHLNSAEQRKEQQDAWLIHVQEEAGILTTHGFIVVLYCLPGENDSINAMLFHKGLPKNQIQRFWDELQ